jgi:hypothetical protein
MLVKLENGVPVEWPVTHSRIKHETPNVSFPRDVTKIDVSAYGYAPFQYADFPDYDSEYQNCEEITPVISGDTYVQTWQVSDKYTPAERTAYDAQKEADRLDALPDMHRRTRDTLLAETDWMALSDVTMTTEMTTYRQALRDLPSHTNWPNLADADWPTKP